MTTKRTFTENLSAAQEDIRAIEEVLRARTDLKEVSVDVEMLLGTFRATRELLGYLGRCRRQLDLLRNVATFQDNLAKDLLKRAAEAPAEWTDTDKSDLLSQANAAKYSAAVIRVALDYPVDEPDPKEGPAHA